MKNPLKDWKHWLTWTVLAGTVSTISYVITGQWQSLLVFASWLVGIAVIDTLMHYGGAQ